MSEEEEKEKYQQEQPEKQPQPVLTQQKSLPTDIKSPLSASRTAIKKIYFPPNEKNEEINEKKESNEKKQEVEITMKFDIIMMKDGLSKHQIFNVKGEDKFGSFEMFRNYNDFLEIRKVLVQRWPGCYVPPLPKKKIVGDMDKENLRERTAFFEDFYKKISQIKFLYYSKEYQLFLRGNKNNADLEKTLKTLPAENYEDILKKYSVCFAELAGKVIENDLMGRIRKFADTLKVLKNELEKMKKVSKKISEADKAYNQNINILVNDLLPNYESTCLREYLKYDLDQEIEDKFIFGKGKDDKLLYDEKNFLKSNAESNNLELVHDIIKTEIKEIEAFQETISVRDQWEVQLNKLIQKNKDYQMTLQNLSKGSAMANLLALGNRHENMHILKENIAKSISDIENLLLVNDIINFILGEIEIRKFKIEKAQKYYSILRLLCNRSFESSFKLTSLWRNIKIILNPENNEENIEKEQEPNSGEK